MSDIQQLRYENAKIQSDVVQAESELEQFKHNKMNSTKIWSVFLICLLKVKILLVIINVYTKEETKIWNLAFWFWYFVN